MEIRLNKNCDHNTLIGQGFQKYGSKYILNIPLYKYKKVPIIELRFLASIMDDCYIEYEIVDCTTDASYTPFYNPEYPGVKNNLVLQKVKRKFKKEINKLIKSGILLGE